MDSFSHHWASDLALIILGSAYAWILMVLAVSFVYRGGC